MPASVNVANTWRTIASLHVNVANTWRTVTNGYVNVAGTWRTFFTSALTPSIASTVTISRNSATYPSTLTGTNFRWTNSTSLTYVFQKSSDNVNFTNIGSAASIANPSVGSSNTVTYALTLADMPAYTSYYRFVVTAVNSTYSTSATSTSTSVSVNQPAPINTVAPTITPSSGTAGVTQYSVNSNGSWNPDDADGVYTYLWQSFDTPTYVSAPGTNNLSTYTPPSNFFTLGYLSPIRCRVTATNASGSTTATSSNTASVSAPVVIPSGGTVSISTNTGNYNVGSIITYSTTGWSGTPTSYSLRLYNGTNPVLTSDPLRASTSSTSGTYTIESGDVPNFFKAFATASNSAGTSTEASSTQVGPATLPVPVNTSAPTIAPTSGTAGVTTYSVTSVGSWTNSPTSYAYQWQYNDQGAVYLSISGATSSSYSPPSNFNSIYISPIRCSVTASNSGGSSAAAFSNTASVSAPVVTVPGLVTSFTATSLLSGSTLSWNATWSAPASDGGATITSYKVYVERAGNSTGPWIASTTSISTTSGGTYSGAYTAASPYTTVNATTPKTIYGRVTGTAATWIRVSVAAVNSAGTGSYNTAIG
jgi:large repetitive protein